MRTTSLPRTNISEIHPDQSIKVLIVDDHILFAEAIRVFLEGHGMRIVGVATDAREALQCAERHVADLILVDLGLPDADGLELGKRLMVVRPEARVVALTGLDDAETVGDALRAGFHGYITKDTALGQLVNLLTTVMSGQVVVPHSLASAALGARTEEEREAERLAEQLTAREREVLSHLVQGMRSQEIAAQLSVSLNTVRTHIQNILTKLQVHSQLEAAAIAMRIGLVEGPSAAGAARPGGASRQRRAAGRPARRRVVRRSGGD